MEQKFGKNSIDIKVLREFAGDYPACLDGGPALTTIEAMVPTRIIRVSGEQLVKRFSQDKKSMDLRCLVAEHLLSQARAR